MSSIPFILLYVSGFQGYYETSAKGRINVTEVFLDAARRCAVVSVVREKATAQKELHKVSGFTWFLPWNWSKKAKCVDSTTSFFFDKFFFLKSCQECVLCSVVLVHIFYFYFRLCDFLYL